MANDSPPNDATPKDTPPAESRAPEAIPTHQPPTRPKPDVTVDSRVLELLVCPETRSTLAFHRQAQVLVSPRPKLAYRILNGVPIMVPSEARALDDGDPLLKR